MTITSWSICSSPSDLSSVADARGRSGDRDEAAGGWRGGVLIEGGGQRVYFSCNRKMELPSPAA
jgi:hypothetical protein